MDLTRLLDIRKDLNHVDPEGFIGPRTRRLLQEMERAFQEGSSTEAWRWAKRLYATCTEMPNPMEKAEATVDCAVAVARLGSPGQALEWLREAQGIYSEGRHLHYKAVAGWMRGWICGQMADWERPGCKNESLALLADSHMVFEQLIEASAGDLRAWYVQKSDELLNDLVAMDEPVPAAAGVQAAPAAVGAALPLPASQMPLSSPLQNALPASQLMVPAAPRMDPAPLPASPTAQNALPASQMVNLVHPVQPPAAAPVKETTLQLHETPFPPAGQAMAEGILPVTMRLFGVLPSLPAADLAGGLQGLATGHMEVDRVLIGGRVYRMMDPYHSQAPFELPRARYVIVEVEDNSLDRCGGRGGRGIDAGDYLFVQMMDEPDLKTLDGKLVAVETAGDGHAIFRRLQVNVESPLYRLEPQSSSKIYLPLEVDDWDGMARLRGVVLLVFKPLLPEPLVVRPLTGSAAAPAAALPPEPHDEGFCIWGPAFQPGHTLTEQALTYSPELVWDDLPPGTRSLALLLEDITVPADVLAHWLLYNLAPSLSKLDEHLPGILDVPGVGRQGLNDFDGVGYEAPCPPAGETHTYRITLYALSCEPMLPPDFSAGQFRETTRTYVLGTARLGFTCMRVTASEGRS